MRAKQQHVYKEMNQYMFNTYPKKIFWARYIGDDFFFRADRSLGAKQESLTIVHFFFKLIVSCIKAVRFPF
jgi:hypothetical protein